MFRHGSAPCTMEDGTSGYFNDAMECVQPTSIGDIFLWLLGIPILLFLAFFVLYIAFLAWAAS